MSQSQPNSVAPLNRFLEHARIEVPLVCGAMYPCSNPELVAAVSEAGGLGIIQPLSMVFVHRHDFREGLRLIKRLTSKPVGMNVIVEKSSKVYQQRMEDWLDIALEEGVRFFVTSLGNPRWVVDKAHAVGGVVYHDVTERKWASKALEAGVDGLIAVNDHAGGHAGRLSPQRLLDDLADLGVPVLAAGGVGSPEDFVRMLEMGYAGVQMGTRFIATEECRAHADYKQAIVKASADDIVLTERITGVPVSVIATPYIRKVGTQAGPIARALLKHRKTKHWMRMVYTLMAARQLKDASLKGGSYLDYFQAGKSVQGVTAVEPASRVVASFARAAGFQPPSVSQEPSETAPSEEKVE
ncbi:Nitronate monooxygenase [compost metagenome]